MAKSKQEKAIANRAAIKNEIRNMKLDPISRNPKKSKEADSNNHKFIEELDINDFD